jgi:hypothetical protein
MNKIAVPDEVLLSKIYLIREQKVMVDFDLADLYAVETKQLKRAVRRNIFRFPEDFMFELTKVEFENLRSQIGTSSWGGTRYYPMAFTEHGVLMLSSVLNSERAIAVNIQIMRIFTRMRRVIDTHKDLILKIEQLERQGTKNSDDIQTIFKILKQLLIPQQKQRKQIGFKREE